MKNRRLDWFRNWEDEREEFNIHIVRNLKPLAEHKSLKNKKASADKHKTIKNS